MRGTAKFWRTKKKKKFEIQQLARANLFKIILNSLFYSKKSTLMHSGAVEMRLEKKRTLIVHNCILSQLDEDGIWKPIAFMSRSLNEAKRNYEIYDKEMLAVMQGFYEWSHYLRGYNAEVEVLTDHQNLMYFCKPQNLNR